MCATDDVSAIRTGVKNKAFYWCFYTKHLRLIDCVCARIEATLFKSHPPTSSKRWSHTKMTQTQHCTTAAHEYELNGFTMPLNFSTPMRLFSHSNLNINLIYLVRIHSIWINTMKCCFITLPNSAIAFEWNALIFTMRKNQLRIGLWNAQHKHLDNNKKRHLAN